MFDGLIAEDYRSIVHTLLTELPPQYRAVITLRWLDDMPLTEVARALGENYGKVKMWHYRALCMLREIALDSGYGPEDLR